MNLPFLKFNEEGNFVVTEKNYFFSTFKELVEYSMQNIQFCLPYSSASHKLELGRIRSAADRSDKANKAIENSRARGRS
jgi:hypothetical protein